jgi:hypothetical protein
VVEMSGAIATRSSLTSYKAPFEKFSSSWETHRTLLSKGKIYYSVDESENRIFFKKVVMFNLKND